MSTAVAKGFAPPATATATKGSYGQGPKFISTIVKTSVCVYRALNPSKIVLDLDCIPNFYANGVSSSNGR